MVLRDSLKEIKPHLLILAAILILADLGLRGYMTYIGDQLSAISLLFFPAYFSFAYPVKNSLIKSATLIYSAFNLIAFLYIAGSYVILNMIIQYENTQSPFSPFTLLTLLYLLIGIGLHIWLFKKLLRK